MMHAAELQIVKVAEMGWVKQKKPRSSALLFHANKFSSIHKMTCSSSSDIRKIFLNKFETKIIPLSWN